MTWIFRLRGGPWHGDKIDVPDDHLPEDGPPGRIFLWDCDGGSCVGHMQWDLDGDVPLQSVVVYVLEDVSERKRQAIYVVGEMPEPWQPELERLESVGAGASSDWSLVAPGDSVTITERDQC